MNGEGTEGCRKDWSKERKKVRRRQGRGTEGKEEGPQILSGREGETKNGDMERERKERGKEK